MSKPSLLQFMERYSDSVTLGDIRQDAEAFARHLLPTLVDNLQRLYTEGHILRKENPRTGNIHYQINPLVTLGQGDYERNIFPKDV